MYRALLLALALPASAAGLDQLKSFIAGTQSFSADFQQTVIQSSGKRQEGGGSVAILRPGRFDWHYTKPYEQRVVADGKQLWVYDPDLQQVTVKKQDQALGDSPAALLAGSNELDKRYQLANQPSSDGIDWVEATPKNRDSGFDKVRIGFKDAKPVAMELRDNFGQQTHIRFSKFVQNPKLDPASFNFTPPKGADVVQAQ
ncbi:outer membrane lipoprotein chaperone LolA [Chitinimonas sp.]|uniref:outer membrane lipoprotein chaperone LolA n=1 Tax=Chitinimonas sp. TaxID=1934313 RepID=UPI0035B2A3AD